MDASKVVKESLRLASVVPWFPRLALEDCEMEGFKIKRGWMNVDAKSVHLDPTVYNDPNKFNPSRFDDESKVPYSFLAFGMGEDMPGDEYGQGHDASLSPPSHPYLQVKVINPDINIEKWGLFPKLKSGCLVIVTCIAENVIP